MKSKINFLVFLFFFIQLNDYCFSQSESPHQPDSLRIYFHGLDKHDKYLVYYNDSLVKTITGKTGFENHYVSIQIDTSILYKDNYWPITVYKKMFFGIFSINTYLKIDFQCMSKYLIIYKDFRVKRRYSLSYMWYFRLP
jgi:uncharacterized protein YfaT (DUF1175 family)